MIDDLDNILNEAIDGSGLLSQASNLASDIVGINTQLKQKLQEANEIAIELFNLVATEVYRKGKIQYSASRDRRIGSRARGQISIEPDWTNGVWRISLISNLANNQALTALAKQKFSITNTAQMVDAIVKAFKHNRIEQPASVSEKPKQLDPLESAVEQELPTDKQPQNDNMLKDYHPQR